MRMYVSFLQDGFSRRILGFMVAASKTVELVTRTVLQAVSARRRSNLVFVAEGVIAHSDAGSQYTSLAFTEKLLDLGIAGSVGRVGPAYDNVFIERFWRSIEQVAEVACWRRRVEGLHARIACSEAGRLAKRILELDAQLDQSLAELASLVQDTAPELLRMLGVGPVSAAVIPCGWAQTRPHPIRGCAGVARWNVLAPSIIR